MNRDQKHSLFTLLYAVVLIDNQVIKIEVDHFFSRLEEFFDSIDDINTSQANSYLSTWFAINCKIILAKMNSPDRVIFLIEHIENLKLYPHRAAIFDMMKNVANADNEFHILEQTFLEKHLKFGDLTKLT